MFKKFVATRMILACTIAFAIILSSEGFGAQVSLAWDQCPGTNVAGYNVYYGSSSGRYTASVNAGNNTSITISGLQTGQTYYFVATAYQANGYESPFSNQVTNSATLAPTFLTQPISQEAVVGTVITLSVSVNSKTPASFQWFMGGSAIDGATNAQLVLPQISEGSAGSYTVVAANPGGGVTSQPAIITVLASPAISNFSAQAVPAGIYTGLFYQTDAAGNPNITEATGGFLPSCIVSANKTYSLRLIVGGLTFNCSGALNGAGEITTIISRASAGLSNLSLTLFASTALGAGRMTGVVSNMDSVHPWTSLIGAVLTMNAFSPTNFIFFSPPSPGQAVDKWNSMLTVSASGAVCLVGGLGDGSIVLQTGNIGIDGSFAVFQSLYHNTGLLAGWITFSQGAPIGNLTWIQPAGQGSYTPGFTNIISFGAGSGSFTNYFQPLAQLPSF